MEKKESGYYVIGGQYESVNYGWTRTLLGAKRLARKNQEYWDNWQGWHTPAIYAAADCEEGTTYYGRKGIYPTVNAMPVATYDKNFGGWCVID